MGKHKRHSINWKSVGKELKSDVSSVGKFGKSIALAPVNAFEKVAGGSSSFLIPALVVGGIVVVYFVYQSKK